MASSKLKIKSESVVTYLQKTFAISSQSHMFFQSIGLNYWCLITHSKTCKFEVWTITTTTYTLPTKKLYQSLLVIKALASTESKYGKLIFHEYKLDNFADFLTKLRKVEEIHTFTHRSKIFFKTSGLSHVSK